MFFGVVIRPQDFDIIVLVLLTAAAFVVLFTAVLGRLFCGWMCPQTIFMEMIFRRCEYWIDGTPSQQRELREGPWTLGKLIRWLTKHALFLALSFVIGSFILSYFIGMEGLGQIVTGPADEHWHGLMAMLLLALAIHLNFGWFREQACTLVCPYGRLQGVLIDANSVVVAYDRGRGEPRAKLKRDDTRSGKGDCVDCGACVRVCPTGIDIRDGTQLECIHCTACIDACNDMMRRVHLPEGLIRYTSEARLAGRRKHRLTGRVLLYAVVTTLLTLLLTILLVARTEIEATLLRAPGTLYFETEAGAVRNLYTIKIVNHTAAHRSLSLRLMDPQEGAIAVLRGSLDLDPEGISEAWFFVELPAALVRSSVMPITIHVLDGESAIDEVITSFVGPEGDGSP